MATIDESVPGDSTLPVLVSQERREQLLQTRIAALKARMKEFASSNTVDADAAFWTADTALTSAEAELQELQASAPRVVPRKRKQSKE